MLPYRADDDLSVGDISLLTEEQGGEEQGEEQSEFILFIKEEIDECFALFDKKKVGEMEVVHLKRALECLGLFMTQTELEEFQELVEVNGTIYYNKFQAACLEKLRDMDQYEFLKAAFSAFDPNQENFIPSDKFKKWMMKLGDPLTDKEAKDLVKMGDPAGKGIIVYEDLAALLSRI